MRWVRSDLIHLTLKFLGEVDESRIGDIGDGVTQAVEGTRPFRLPVRNFGAFPTVKHPRVVWVGCEGLPVLELLEDSVEREMSAFGFAIEGRPFRPHLTIGRTARAARRSDFEDFDKELDRLDFFEEPNVATIDLMRSTLGRGGPRYERLLTVGLTS